jgi:hypothetical protein
VSTPGNENAAALIREVGEGPAPAGLAEDDEVDLGIATALSIHTSRRRLSFLTTLATFPRM